MYSCITKFFWDFNVVTFLLSDGPGPLKCGFHVSGSAGITGKGISKQAKRKQVR